MRPGGRVWDSSEQLQGLTTREYAEIRFRVHTDRYPIRRRGRTIGWTVVLALGADPKTFRFRKRAKLIRRIKGSQRVVVGVTVESGSRFLKPKIISIWRPVGDDLWNLVGGRRYVP